MKRRAAQPVQSPIARRPAYGEISAAIAAWFGRAARDLPWRRAAEAGAGYLRDPYFVLVSELMLQQTQVSRVVSKFEEFLRRFPTVHDLAEAEESQVLALWSGLGYYRRARLLHQAARAVVRDHAGVLPFEPEGLLGLPGVGRYTAGAIASIAYERPVPLVDGNVARVLFRIHGRDAEHNRPSDLAWAWDEATLLVNAAAAGNVSVAALNEGLMELGALLCSPAAPACSQCPASAHCAAFAQGRQDEIPRPKARLKRSIVSCHSIALVDEQGRILLEQRPDRGMWASMWQLPTVEIAGASPLKAKALAPRFGLEGGAQLERLARFTHGTTHRDVRFTLWLAVVTPAERRRLASGRRWVSAEELGTLGLSNPQRRMIGEVLSAEEPAELPTSRRRALTRTTRTQRAGPPVGPRAGRRAGPRTGAGG